MKKTFTSAFLLLALCLAHAEESNTAYFDFTEPESLNPSIAKPAQKEWVDLDGKSFTDGDVKITFTASESGNTHVRLFSSYDAGCDARIYDGEMLTVSSTNPDMLLDNIKFTMSLSGNATGSNDINFEPSVGTFTWEDEQWTADDAEVATVDLTSFRQSRLATMTVTLKSSASVAAIELNNESSPVYYTISGVEVMGEPSTPGIYIRVAANRAEKVVIK